MALNPNIDKFEALAKQMQAESLSSKSSDEGDSAPPINNFEALAKQIQAAGLPPKPESLGSKVGDIFGDIAVGGSRFGAGITSAPHNIATYLSQHPTITQGVSGAISPFAPPVLASYFYKKLANLIPAPSPRNYEKLYNIHPGLAGKVIEGISQYAPFIMGGGTSLPGQIVAGAGGAVAADSKAPLTSAAEGAITSALGYGVGVAGSELLGGAIKGGRALLQKISKTRNAMKLAKPYVNELLNSTKNPAGLSEDLKTGVINALKKEQKISKENYQPLNESTLNLRDLSKNKNVPFPQYNSKLLDIAVERQNLKNIFGQATEDLSPSVVREAKKGFTAMDPPEDKNFSFGLQEAMTRIHSLGKLGTVLARKDKYAASQLFGLRDALTSDTKNILENSGHEDLSDQLTKASDHYRDNVIPFYKTPELSKIATSTEDRPYYLANGGYKLAKDLHNKNNSAVLDKLSDSHKTGLLGKLLSLGKETDKGKVTALPKDIAQRWNGLDIDEKQVAGTYAPKSVDFLDDLSDKLIGQPTGIKEHTLGALEDAVIRNIPLPKSFQPAGISSEEAFGLLHPTSGNNLSLKMRLKGAALDEAWEKNTKLDRREMPEKYDEHLALKNRILYPSLAHRTLYPTSKIGIGTGLGLQAVAQPGTKALIDWVNKN